jgi:hypothetical protein
VQARGSVLCPGPMGSLLTATEVGFFHGPFLPLARRAMAGPYPGPGPPPGRDTTTGTTASESGPRHRHSDRSAPASGSLPVRTLGHR